MDQSLRERKKERTGAALVAAGLRLFAEHGFDAVTVADVAAEADVAPRTFHRYFPDKVELLFADDQRLREDVAGALAAAPAGSGPLELVRAVLAVVADAVAAAPEAYAARERLLAPVPVLRARDLAKRAALEQLVAEHLAERLGVDVDADVRPRWWAGVATATFTAARQTWLAAGGDLRDHLAAAEALLPPPPA